MLACLALAVPGAGCQIFVDAAECTDLDDVCPNLTCDNYKQDRNGCSLCECVEVEEPVVCFSNADCPSGQACDTVNYCERDPGCVGQLDCPAVCWGRCVDAPSTCRSDADCPVGQICTPFGNARPAPPPDDGGQAEPAPPMACSSDADCGAGSACVNGVCSGGAVPPPPADGVCVPAECADRVAIDLPACPPGTEPTIDFTLDPCGATVCRPVDGCRNLDPETCRNTPGCEVFLEDCCGGTEPSNCDCAPIERCAATDDCIGLDPESCRQNPACVLVDAGTSGGGSSGGAPCMVCDSAGNCSPCDADPIAPPPPDLVCVARPVLPECLSDADCGPGEQCALRQICAVGCETRPDGSEACVDVCWIEGGQCAPSGSACWDIFDPVVCENTPGCELIDGAPMPVPCPPDDPNCGGLIALPVCQPRATSCQLDADCGGGQRCELREICPPCDPQNGNDLGCLAPCYVEGVCVDGQPLEPCAEDADCRAGGECVLVEVCGCSAPPGADCAPECRTEGVCHYENATCYVDADCRDDQLCDFSQGCFFPSPSGLVACQGVCVAREPPPPSGAYCLGDDQCASGQACVNHADVCLDNPHSDVEACWGWCVGACGDAITPAQDPTTGQCVVFADTCIPPGWVVVNGCE